MNVSITTSGEINISELTNKERTQIKRLLDMANRNESSGNFSFDDNCYILRALELAEEYACKHDCFNELCWLRETDIRLKWRISNIIKAKTCAHNEKLKDEAPELIPCPRCGAPAVLKYRGYLPEYFCSDEKCGNEGGMHETKEGAAYNWNTQKERNDFKEAVREVERKELPSLELERLAFLLLGEIMKKEGVIKNECD